MESKKNHFFLIFLTSFISFSGYAVFCKYFASMTGLEVQVQVYLTTIFLMGLGVSSYFLERKKNILSFFVKAEYLLAMVFLFIPLIFQFFNIYYQNFHTPSWVWIPFSIMITLTLGLITGVELPTYLEVLKKQEHKILFWNYLGALIAGIFLVRFIETKISLYDLIFYLALLNFIAYIFIHISLIKTSLIKLILPSSIWFLCFFVVVPFEKKHRDHLYKWSYLGMPLEHFSDGWSESQKGGRIESYQSQYQKIDIVPANIHQFNHNDSRWGLFLNRRPQLFSDSEVVYHQTMALYPSLYFQKKFKNVLILGGGDLGLAREIFFFSPESEITVVELDEKMIDLAKNNAYLKTISQIDQIKDHIKIINDDAIHFLRTNKETFDLVLADFPYPVSFELGKLYSKEFFALIKKRMIEDGVFMLDFPASDSIKIKKPLEILIKTLRSAGFLSQNIIGDNITFVMSSEKNLKQIGNFDIYLNRLDNRTLINLIDRNDLIEKLNIEEASIHSLFRPAKGFRIE